MESFTGAVAISKPAIRRTPSHRVDGVRQPSRYVWGPAYHYLPVAITVGVSARCVNRHHLDSFLLIGHQDTVYGLGLVTPCLQDRQYGHRSVHGCSALHSS